MRPGEMLSLTITLPNEQHIEVPEAVVWSSRGQEFAAENLAIEPHTPGYSTCATFRTRAAGDD